MISPRRNQWSLVLVLALLGSAAWAGEPNEAPVHLEFEISPTPEEPFSASKPAYGPDKLWLAFVSYKPTYAVAIPVVDPTEYLRGQEYLEIVGRGEGLSERQKAFLTASKDYFRIHWRPRPDPNGAQSLWAYAVTQEDVRKMAQAYFQYGVDRFRMQVATAEKEIRIATENMENAQKRIAELDQQIETARQSLEESQKTVPYRTEDEAHEAIGELDRMLNTAQVEIAGIKARIMAIQGYQRGVQYQESKGAKGETVRVPVAHEKASPEAAPKLDMLFIEESIALRGAQAREQMATRLREQANRFVDLKSTLATAPRDKEAQMRVLHNARQGLSTWQSRLASFQQNEPKIPARIVIYPVKWVDEPSQN
jgi:hypothetical protein